MEYNCFTVLYVSAVQQSNNYIYTYNYDIISHFRFFFSHLGHNREWSSSLRHTVGSHYTYLHFTHSSVYMSIPVSQFIQLPSLAQLVKNPPTMQETPVQFLGWEDLPEKGTATRSSILFWRIPWTEEATVHGVAKSLTGLSDFHFHHPLPSWYPQLCSLHLCFYF